MSRILYFAYGSNMLTRRLQHSSRVPSANPIGVGFVEGYHLTFNKRSCDGSGKCDAELTSETTARLYGVIYEIPRSEKFCLDRAEGLGIGYEEKAVELVAGSKRVRAITYVATDKDPSLRPYDWYKDLVVAGAKEHNLPKDYIAWLEQTSTVVDPEPERANVERAILKSS